MQTLVFKLTMAILPFVWYACRVNFRAPKIFRIIFLTIRRIRNCWFYPKFFSDITSLSEFRIQGCQIKLLFIPSPVLFALLTILANLWKDYLMFRLIILFSVQFHSLDVFSHSKIDLIWLINQQNFSFLAF